jgi:hypothetical protein
LPDVPLKAGKYTGFFPLPFMTEVSMCILQWQNEKEDLLSPFAQCIGEIPLLFQILEETLNVGIVE